MQRYPVWLKKEFSPHGVAREVRELLGDLQLATVCESAVCPNLRECYSQRQLTFMILGATCTRSCRFCAVDNGRPQPVAADEPWRVAEAVRRLGLRHAVITSVARDDLQDEGAGHFVEVLRVVRQQNPGITVEVLVPDFHGREVLIRRVVEEGRPEVFAHNLETIERLSALLRPQADYRRSLDVLRYAASLGGGLVKSSLMVGLGETPLEVEHALRDLLEAGATHLTIGQYLRPDAAHLPVLEYVSPQRFALYERMAYDTGFQWVKAGPFVRSSYHAVDAINSTHALH
ncbi:MAG: lipoyl synthase [Candidatus Omnitrophica bacterium]|nr:lipoyl synthase [Candidatus Omnitrophota bacterium]